MIEQSIDELVAIANDLTADPGDRQAAKNALIHRGRKKQKNHPINSCALNEDGGFFGVNTEQ